MLPDKNPGILPDKLISMLEIINVACFKIDINSSTLNECKLHSQDEKSLVMEHKLRLSFFNLKKLNQEDLEHYQRVKDEIEIELWLNRIIEFYNHSNLNKNDSTQKQISYQIIDFLNEIPKLNQELKSFLFSHHNSLNCLIFSLLLSRNKEQWNKTMSLFVKNCPHNYQIENILGWVYSTLIEADPKEAAKYLHLLQESNHVIPDTPAHRIYSFIEEANQLLEKQVKLKTICGYFKNDSTPILNFNLIKEMVSKSFIACAYSFNHSLVMERSVQLVDLFIQAYTNTPQYLILEDELLRFVTQISLISYIKRVANEKDVGRVKTLILFIEKYPGKINGLDRHIQIAAINIASQCFDSRHYELARNLLMLVKNNDLDDDSDLKSNLFELCYLLDRWLGNPNLVTLKDKQWDSLFNNTLDALSSTKTLKQQTLLVLKDLGERTLKAFANTKQPEILNEYEAQLKRIIKLLGHTNSAHLSQKLLSLKKQMGNVKTKEVKTKHPIPFDFDTLPVSKQKKKAKPPKKTIPQDQWDEIIEEDALEQPLTKALMQPELITQQSTIKSAPCFFSRPQESTALSIEKSKLPEAIINTILNLKHHVSEGELFLSGGAVISMIENKIPNDYDLLLILPNDSKCSLNALQNIMGKYSKTCEIRGSSHPILHCVMDNHIKVDFTLLFKKPKQSTDECIRTDTSNRDFNISAFVLSLNHLEQQLKVISYTEALDSNFQKTIKVTYKNPASLFLDDPTRIFRLTHLLLQFPNYALDETLIKILKDTKPKWTSIFKSYIESLPNKSRLNHALRKLFLRYDFDDLINTLDQLDFLPTLTHRSKKDLHSAIQLIPREIDPMDKIIAWMIATTFYHQKKNTKINPPPTLSFFVWNDRERHWINFLFHKGKKPGEPKELLQLMDRLIDPSESLPHLKLK